MSDMFETENKDIQVLTHQYVEELTKIWTRIFDHEMCKFNLRKLAEHAKTFYEELVSESLDKQTYIEEEIKELREEAETLRRLLKTEVQLPSHLEGGKPLLVVQSEMDKSLENLREELRQRREQICELLLEQETLCEELGEAPRELLADPLPTAEEITEFREYLEGMREERVKRLDKISVLRREIKAFLQVLELQVTTETEDRLLNHREIKLNKDTFVALQRMYDRYKAQMEELREHIDGMRKKLESLWNRLNTSPNTRNKFKRYNDYNQHTYDMFYGELQRCEALKSQNIKVYVQQIREEIREWWDKTLKSDLQRNRFSHFNSSCYTDDLLVLHEMELADLKSYYETNRQIFELYAERKLLWDRMTALEAKASEPGRYNNRGGQLLKEEKERKTIATKLPKIEQQIGALVAAYEEREHTTFLVFGENILEVMAAEWQKKRKEKEKMSSARKNAGQTPLSKIGSTMRTPMSVKNASTVVSLRSKTPSTTTNMSAIPVSAQKRKLKLSEKQIPVAKRSLMHALNSPSVFLKPTNNNNTQHSTATVSSKGKSSSSSTSASASSSQTHFKSPLKKMRVIGTTIRRKSGRLSGSHKKRRSVNKNSSGAAKSVAPKIVINSDGYSDETTDDTYDSFQKCIEPASRSSVIQNTSFATNTSTRSKRMQKIVADENARLAQLPKPCVMSRTPSKQNLLYGSTISLRAHTPPKPHSPGPCSTGRKLTTKNLPIII